MPAEYLNDEKFWTEDKGNTIEIGNATGPMMIEFPATECGCTIQWPERGVLTIKHCALHAHAPALLAAAKEYLRLSDLMRKLFGTDEDPPPTKDENALLEAIAACEGKPEGDHAK